MSTTPWASFDAYLFDLDGTLVDTAPDINVALNFTLQQAGLPLVEESLTRHWIGHGARVVISQALTHHNEKRGQHAQQEIDMEALLKVFLDYYSAHLAEHSVIYPTVVETLNTLRAQGAKLAVVTNKITRLSVPLLEQIGLREHFDLVVCGDTARAPKPDPAPVEYCLEKFAVAPDRVLFVGDSETDVNAARAAGVAVVCVRDGYNHGVDVTSMDLDGVIDTFAELLA